MIPTPPPTTPMPPATRRPRFGAFARSLRQRGPEHGRDVVIRVPLGFYSRTYAYACRGPVNIGALVEVDAAVQGPVVVPVVGFGRGGYSGPLKRARVLR